VPTISRPRLLAAGVVAAAAATVLTAPAAAAPAAVPCPRVLPLAAVTERAALGCDPADTSVEHLGLRVAVPAPGQYRSAAATGPTHGAELLVLRFPDGTLQAGADPEALLAAAGLAEPEAAVIPPHLPDTQNAACHEDDYSHMSFKRTSQVYEWIYDPGFETEPVAGFAEPHPNAIAEILAGAINMTTGTNGCLLPNVLGLTEQQVAYNPRAEGLMTADGYCDNDEKNANNIVDWGALPGDYLGYTCAHGFISFLGIRLQPVETDVRFDSEAPWLTPEEQARLASGIFDCQRWAFDIESVSAHEFGHVWGLGHAEDAIWQTMRPTMMACSLAFRDLGYGDWLSLSRKYPLPPGL
jgi:hypothetical protein